MRLATMSGRSEEASRSNHVGRDVRQPKRTGAMLADIYSWLAEGFDTADLKDGKALLDELSD
jgi:hypothetical protein